MSSYPFGNRKYEHDQDPDSPDKKRHDFRDDLITLLNKEIIDSYQIYQFAEHGVGLVIGDSLENEFEIGLAHGGLYLVSNNLDNYCTISDRQKIDFIKEARAHRLQEILEAGDQV